MDVLSLTYEEVERLLTPEMCLESQEEAYRESAEKRTVDRSRSHCYIPLAEPHKWYCLKTMEGGDWDQRFEEKGLKNVDSYSELADLVLGRAVGRNSDREITCFVTNQGPGIQFAALGSRILRAAREKKVGRYENWDHLLQSVHP